MLYSFHCIQYIFITEAKEAGPEMGSLWVGVAVGAGSMLVLVVVLLVGLSIRRHARTWIHYQGNLCELDTPSISQSPSLGPSSPAFFYGERNFPSYSDPGQSRNTTVTDSGETIYDEVYY